MGRRAKVAIGVAAGLLALLALNAALVGRDSGEASVTVPGGRILDLPSGEIQALDRGPREAPAIVLLHCYTCAIDWWDGMLPKLEAGHRVVAVDLLGHGGSEKPTSGYTPPEQAQAVAEALERLGVRDAVVVGHSLGGVVAVALAERSPELVERVAIVDMPPDESYAELDFLAELTFRPLIGEALWTIKFDSAVREGLRIAFRPGYEIPDAFVEDVKRLTYNAYDDSAGGEFDYVEARPLDSRMEEIGKPLMALMGAEEQIVQDPSGALARYRRVGAETHLIEGAGHSPNVERPGLVAGLVLRFAKGAR
jgi:pimeloyl-ACP methyl ester carboxylesterase